MAKTFKNLLFFLDFRKVLVQKGQIKACSLRLVKAFKEKKK
jgi:hypothetical protein